MEKERFSLLLLEPGEYYFEDYSVYLSKEEESFNQKDINNELVGRLKICSKSLVFDPRNISKPIVKIPFKECTEIKKLEVSLLTEYSEMLLIECDQFVEMLAGNILTPYSFKYGNHKFFILFNYAKIEDCLSHICQLHRASSLPIAEQNQMIATIAYDRQCRIKFDKMWLENFDEKIIFETIGNKISPLVVNPGKIVLSTLNLYFQSFNNIEPLQFIKIRLSHVKTIIKRRFLLQHVGMEIYGKDCSTISHLYFSLQSTCARDKLHNIILEQPELHLSQSDQEIMTLHWQNGIISNFDYLLYINSLADRTFNDLTQYPIFPWVITDYSSSTLNLSDPKSFRDLSKPIGALNPERLKRLKDRYNEMCSPKFLYGSHYSTPGFVLFYLVRKYPHFMLCLQNGRFDHPDRMFNSVYDTWKNVLTNMSDFKELVPEFYDISKNCDFLNNNYNIHFGYKHDGSRVGDVTLPPWANGSRDFVNKLRAALESDVVSCSLHNWIDLIFGYKQNGEESEKANNIFYHLCYEGAIDLNSINDWNQRHALEVQIMEFGQIPKQIFKKPHPARSSSIFPPAFYSAGMKVVDQHFGYHWEWNNIELELQFCFKSHKDSVTDITMSDNSSIILSVSSDTFLKVYNIINFKQERSISLSRVTLSSVILLDDNITAIIGCWNNTIFVYNIECGSLLDTINGHEDAVTSIAWCKKTKRLLSVSLDCTIRIWRANLPWIPVKPNNLIAQLQHETKISQITISRNEELLASGTEIGDIFIWSLNTYTVVTRLIGHSDQVSNLKFSYADERIISCSRDHSFRVFDLSTGSEVYSKFLDEELNCVLWDDYHVVLGGNMGTLFFYDLIKNTLVKRIHAHADGVVAIVCNEKGSLIVTGSRDHKVSIWRVSLKLL